jgi:putative nucleotidyltransferase with HDIG domain
MPPSSNSDRAGVRPIAALGPDHLESALVVVEVVQALSALEDVSEMLASLARNLTEILDADACMVSTFDPARGMLRNTAGYARPPFAWQQTPAEHRIADYPRTVEALNDGRPYTCILGAEADSREARWLVELGYRTLLMLPLPVESKPFALIEVYDKAPREFAASEIRLSEALALEAGKMIVRARMQEHLEDAYIATLGTLAAALEAKDAYTNDHAAQIAELAAAVCEQLHVAASDMRMIRLAALLHDIGKIGVPEAILHKRGPLDDREWAVMQEHPRIGARILEPVPYFAELVPLVTSSHERYDGTGYPDRLEGDEIPLGSRVIAVCDAFHAMTEDRVYRKAVPVDEALREIVRCSGSQFDPSCVEAMLAVVRTKGWPRFTRDRLVRLAHTPSW